MGKYFSRRRLMGSGISPSISGLGQSDMFNYYSGTQGWIPLNPANPYYWMGRSLHTGQSRRVFDHGSFLTDAVVDDMAVSDECLLNAEKFRFSPQFCSDASWDLKLEIIDIAQATKKPYGTLNLRLNVRVDPNFSLSTEAQSKKIDLTQDLRGRRILQFGHTLKEIISEFEDQPEIYVRLEGQIEASQKLNLKELMNGAKTFTLDDTFVIRAYIERTLPEGMQLDEIVAQRAGATVKDIKKCSRYLKTQGLDTSLCLMKIDFEMDEKTWDDEFNSGLKIDILSKKLGEPDVRGYVSNRSKRHHDKIKVTNRLAQVFSAIYENFYNKYWYGDSLLVSGRDGVIFSGEKHCKIELLGLKEKQDIRCRANGKLVEISISQETSPPYADLALPLVEKSLEHSGASKPVLDQVKRSSEDISNAYQVQAVQALADAQLKYSPDVLKIQTEDQLESLEDKIESFSKVDETSTDLPASYWGEILQK